jgi:hypothetical protein
VDPQILAKLQEELLNPGPLAYFTKTVQREVKKAQCSTPKDGETAMKRLEQEKRKLQPKSGTPAARPRRPRPSCPHWCPFRTAHAGSNWLAN